MRLSRSKPKTLLIILSIVIISGLILAACGPSGEGLAGAAGGEKGKPEDTGGGPPEDKGKPEDQAGKSQGQGPDQNQGQGQGQGTQEPKGADKKAESTKEHGVGHIAVTICHATGSAKNPYVEITIDLQAVLNGHELHHPDDIIPAPAEGCPTPPPPPPPPDYTNLCHFNEDGSYSLVSVLNTPDLGGHASHLDDIYPVPTEGCPSTPPPPPPPPPPDFTINPVSSMCVNFIIFHTFRDGNLEIYRLDGVEGTDSALLYNLSLGPDSVDSRPTRSPDDQWVVFESDRDGNVELYLANSIGSFLDRLTYTTSNNINPVFLADNQTVVFQSDRNGNWDLFSINIFTLEVTQLTTDPNDDVFPFASPDPSWIVYQSNRVGNEDLYLLNVFTGEEYQLTSGTGNEIFPAWSATGEKIAFLSDENGDWSLYTVDYNGQNVEFVAGGAGINVANHSWSPDGTRIAYQAEQNGNVDIFTHDFTSGEFYQLTDYLGADSAPSWDCGGQTVSFTTLRDGDPNIYQVPWQGGDQTFLTNNPATDKWSEWSPSKEQGSRGW
jgi:Tol biopolymer transport system component